MANAICKWNIKNRNLNGLENGREKSCCLTVNKTGDDWGDIDEAKTWRHDENQINTKLKLNLKND